MNMSVLCLPLLASASASASAEDSDRKRKRGDKEAPAATKKIHTQLQKWNQKKQELKQDSEQPPPVGVVDTVMMACLLCQRKFKSEQDLKKHQSLSTLHKENLQVPALVTKAQDKTVFLLLFLHTPRLTVHRIRLPPPLLLPSPPPPSQHHCLVPPLFLHRSWPLTPRKKKRTR
ncbi:hypothetical protein BDF14DRAFT_509652 [Spinellus fusiger]|nr:hypothetical protein BDF14DRAFT_509652 [Spinellus fusiger]